jgi:hypothetical protein
MEGNLLHITLAHRRLYTNLQEIGALTNTITDNAGESPIYLFKYLLQFFNSL